MALAIGFAIVIFSYAILLFSPLYNLSLSKSIEHEFLILLSPAKLELRS